MKIRAATADDAEALAEMIVAISAEAGTPHAVLSADDIRRDGFGADPAFACLIAAEEGEGRAVGYALYYPIYSPEFGQRGLLLHDLYVRPAWRRRGVGRALLAGLAHVVEAHPRYRFLWWNSDADDRAAQALYRAVGAVEEAIVGHALDGAALAKLAGEAQG